MTRVFTLITLLFCLQLPLLLQAQFPTAIGTKWEYFQFFEDQQHPMAVIDAFVDEVTADTTVLGTTYHKVTRSGRMYYGGWFYARYDTMDASYFYRVAGSQVRILDSVSGGTAYESLLYEFGLSVGDTVWEIPENLINLSPVSKDSFYLKWYDYDSACWGTCDTFFTLGAQPASPPLIPNAYKWEPNANIIFLDDIGTIFSNPYQIVLDVYGQYYYLNSLTSGGNTLYQNSFIANAVQDPKTVVPFTLSPNPAAGPIRIECEKGMQGARIYSQMGSLIREIHFPQAEKSQTLSTEGLSKGLYFLEVFGEDWHSSRQLVIQ